MNKPSIKIAEESPYTVNGVEAANAIMQAYNVEMKTGERCVMNIIGAPGNAKTSIIRQVYERISAMRAEQNLGSTALYSLRLNQADPTDLKGVPCFVDKEGLKTCTFASPDVFPIKGVPSSGSADYCIIHMDEMPQAPKSMQNLAANIIDGVIGDNYLDFSRTLVIVSGNRKQDNAATFDTPSNVKTRMTTLNLSLSFSEWKSWAMESGKISGVIIGFLEQYYGEYFQQHLPNSETTYANPRTWHMLSNYVTSWDGTLRDWANSPLTPPLVAGTIGPGAAVPFLNFIRSLDHVDIESVCEGRNPEAPSADRVDAWYMVSAEFAYRVSQLGNKIESKVKNGASTSSSLLSSEEFTRFKNMGEWMLKAYKEKKCDLAFITLTLKLQNTNAVNHMRTVGKDTAWHQLLLILVEATNRK